MKSCRTRWKVQDPTGFDKNRFHDGILSRSNCVTFKPTCLCNQNFSIFVLTQNSSSNRPIFRHYTRDRRHFERKKWDEKLHLGTSGYLAIFFYISSRTTKRVETETSRVKLSFSGDILSKQGISKKKRAEKCAKISSVQSIKMRQRSHEALRYLERLNKLPFIALLLSRP